MNKPKVKLIGTDGNAFALLGRCRKAALIAGWDNEDISKFIEEATLGDYNNLLATINKYFEVC